MSDDTSPEDEGVAPGDDTPTVEEPEVDGTGVALPPPEVEAVRPPAPLVPGIRLLRILWRMLGPLAVAANLVGWSWLLGAGEELKRQALTSGLFIIGFSFVASLIHEVVSPKNAELRLVDLKDHQAQRLMTIVRGLLFVLLGTELAIWLVQANDWNPAVASLLTLLRNCGLLAFGWAALSKSWIIRRLKPKTTHSYLDVIRALLVRVILPLTLLTALFCLIVHALGYEALAWWVLGNAAYTVLLFLGAVVAHRWARGRLHATMSFLRDERIAEGEGQTAPWWIGIERILGGGIQLGAIIAAFFLLLGIWDLSLDDLRLYLDKPIIEAFGGQTWGGVVRSVLQAAFAWIVYALVRNLLIFIVFPRADVELGARYAMLTVLRYAIITVIGLIVLGAIGVDGDTLTIFAGGATVGLAFGLKDIFSNFFSGMIMLLERPVRVGDTVEIGDTKGKIEAVRLRGTTIRTFDGTTVIVPNTDMIGSRLANLTHGFDTARMQVDVGVSYNEDPRRIEQILLQVAARDRRVQMDPEPVVRFTEFGNSSLDFSLRVWTHDVDDRWAMVSDLRKAIFAAFRKAKIEIPFPQQDLHIRSDFRASGTELPSDPPSA